MTEFDLIATGRVGVDLYPRQSGVPLRDVTEFARFLGGSATNVAVQAARLGSRSAIVTKVGNDQFGEYVRAALDEFGVERRWVGTDPTLRTPIAFCELFPPDDFPLLFYREPSAPDIQLAPSDFDLAAIRAAKVFWTTGTGLSDEPSRSTLLDVLADRADSATDPITIHDLDHRPMFWSGSDDPGAFARQALEHATVAVGNQDEVEVAVGTRDPRQAAERLLDLGLKLAIVKQGPQGVYARSTSEEIEFPPIRLEVINGLGAGDAFGGTLAHGLARGWSLEQTLRSANAAGALAASRLACADDFPTESEILETLRSSA